MAQKSSTTYFLIGEHVNVSQCSSQTKLPFRVLWQHHAFLRVITKLLPSSCEILRFHFWEDCQNIACSVNMLWGSFRHSTEMPLYCEVATNKKILISHDENCQNGAISVNMGILPPP